MTESEDKAVYFLILADDSKRKVGQLRIFVPPDANGTETIDEISKAVNDACLLIRKKHLHCPSFGYDGSGISALKNDSAKNWEKIHGVIVDMRLNQLEHISLREEMWPDLGEKAPSLFRKSKLRMLVCLLPFDAPIPADVQDVKSRQNSVFRFEVVRNSSELEARISGWLGDIATFRRDVSLGRKESLVKAIGEFYQRLR